MTTYRDILDRDIERAMETWGDREGMDDALNGRPINPRRHTPHPAFEGPYRIAYRETRAGMDELAAIEATQVGQAAGARLPDNTTRELVGWFALGLATGAWLTAIAWWISTVIA